MVLGCGAGAVADDKWCLRRTSGPPEAGFWSCYINGRAARVSADVRIITLCDWPRTSGRDSTG